MTTDQPGLFDARAGEQLKEQGIDRAVSVRQAEVAMARQIAVDMALASPNRRITADHVQSVLKRRGIDLGNAAGAIFKGKNWRWTGECVQSSRVSNHSRILRVWELVG